MHGGLRNADVDEPIAAGDSVILTGCFAIAIVIVVKGMTVKVKKERGEV